jgi:hypothetical protein
MPTQVVLAGGENDRRALDPAAVAQNRAPHAPVPRYHSDAYAGADVGAAARGLRKEAAVEAGAREAMAGGGQPGLERRAVAPNTGAGEGRAPSVEGASPSWSSSAAAAALTYSPQTCGRGSACRSHSTTRNPLAASRAAAAAPAGPPPITSTSAPSVMGP